eukprot:Amastigsp_a350629_10.p5 type:complete len:112 gc:universal Amastigsp_a350629_10:465-130(-)
MPDEVDAAKVTPIRMPSMRLWKPSAMMFIHPNDSTLKQKCVWYSSPESEASCSSVRVVSSCDDAAAALSRSETSTLVVSPLALSKSFFGCFWCVWPAYGECECELSDALCM